MRPLSAIQSPPPTQRRSVLMCLWCVSAEDDDGKWVPVVAFECRGIEPTAFHPEVRRQAIDVVMWVGQANICTSLAVACA